VEAGALRFVAASGVVVADVGTMVANGVAAVAMKGRVCQAPAPLRWALPKRAHKPKPVFLYAPH